MNDMEEYCYREAKRLRIRQKIEINTDKQTGIVTSEIYYQDDRSHRDGGPATIIRDSQTGIVTREYWSKAGRMHREDGPAFIHRDPRTGSVITEQWFLDGKEIASRSSRRQPCASMKPG